MRTDTMPSLELFREQSECPANRGDLVAVYSRTLTYAMVRSRAGAGFLRNA